MSTRAIPPTRKPRKSLFWPGFVLGLLLTTAISCGSLTSYLGLTDITLSDIQGSGPRWTPPPPATATPEVSDAVAASSAAESATAPTGTFGSAQARNVTSSRVHIRQTPGHLGKPDTDILAVIPPGDVVEIISGPETANNMTWWLVRYGAVEGWVAEAGPSGIQILGRVQ